MSEYFIQKLFIKDVRGVKDFKIPLSETERKHLIITGKNGSGKTSVLEQIKLLFDKLIDNGFSKILQHGKDISNIQNTIKQLEIGVEALERELKKLNERKIAADCSEEDIELLDVNIDANIHSLIANKKKIEDYRRSIAALQREIDDFFKIDIDFSGIYNIYNEIANGKYILTYFRAKRENIPVIPQTPTKQSFQEKYATDSVLSKTFVQYMLNLKTNQAFAQIKNDMETVEKIGGWFDNLEAKLKELFGESELKLVFYDQDFSFKIEYDDKSFGLNELSDGYSSILAILTELLLRMEAHNAKAYDMQGIVLIDEIETHLHVELQKKILPFLISFFPKIQFIVTTHSPFVLSSVSNAVICDLERREIVDSERFVNASYSQIVKNYFEVDSEFSRVLLNDIKQYEEMVSLFENGELDESRQKELLDLDIKLEKISPMLSDEIYLRFKEAQEKIQNND